jgi:molybdopterin-containing oxidoreductase family membrane subunit
MALLRYESQVRGALIEGAKDYHQVTEDICRPVEARPTRLWWIGFSVSLLMLCFGILSVTMEVTYGVGQWNLNKTVVKLTSPTLRGGSVLVTPEP